MNLFTAAIVFIAARLYTTGFIQPLAKQLTGILFANAFWTILLHLLLYVTGLETYPRILIILIAAINTVIQILSRLMLHARKPV